MKIFQAVSLILFISFITLGCGSSRDGENTTNNGSNSDGTTCLTNCGTNHTASGTYTFDEQSAELLVNFQTTTFTQCGPGIGVDKYIISMLTPIYMEWADLDAKTVTIWRKNSGTSETVIRTWKQVDSDGNTYEITINSDGSFLLTGNIISCSDTNDGGNGWELFGDNECQSCQLEVWIDDSKVNSVEYGSPDDLPTYLSKYAGTHKVGVYKNCNGEVTPVTCSTVINPEDGQKVVAYLDTCSEGHITLDDATVQSETCTTVIFDSISNSPWFEDWDTATVGKKASGIKFQADTGDWIPVIAEIILPKDCGYAEIRQGDMLRLFSHAAGGLGTRCDSFGNDYITVVHGRGQDQLLMTKDTLFSGSWSFNPDVSAGVLDYSIVGVI